jgi:hypothetical protein
MNEQPVRIGNATMQDYIDRYEATWQIGVSMLKAGIELIKRTKGGAR